MEILFGPFSLRNEFAICNVDRERGGEKWAERGGRGNSEEPRGPGDWGRMGRSGGGGTGAGVQGPGGAGGGGGGGSGGPAQGGAGAPRPRRQFDDMPPSRPGITYQ